MWFSRFPSITCIDRTITRSASYPTSSGFCLLYLRLLILSFSAVTTCGASYCMQIVYHLPLASPTLKKSSLFGTQLSQHMLKRAHATYVLCGVQLNDVETQLSCTQTRSNLGEKSCVIDPSLQSAPPYLLILCLFKLSRPQFISWNDYVLSIASSATAIDGS